MPRRMSFSMTKAQFLDGSKTVTRRLGWRNLEPGEELVAVEKCMGLQKGERQKVLGRLRVIDVRREPLSHITEEDVVSEGFPNMTTGDFIGVFANAMKCWGSTIVTRIEFERIGPTP